MRHKPRNNYSGLTIVLSNPSRFDTYELISGTAGHYFTTRCLGKLSRYSCDIRTADTIEEDIIPNTKSILLLGEPAFKRWTTSLYNDYSLNEQRGTPLQHKFDPSILVIASYSPQDTMDIVDYEDKLNPLADHSNINEYENENEEEGSEKVKGKTKRSNYRFWLKRDTERALFCLQRARQNSRYDFVLAPPIKLIVDFLFEIEGENLYVDIETSVDGGYNLWCIGIATDTSPVYVIPIFGLGHSLFYSDCHLIFKALARAMDRNTVVCHNGFAFDLWILAWRYHIPIGKRHYDTMIAHHRCFPGVEKSLGHLMSTWTWEPYHKDEGLFCPKSIVDLRKLWEYNAKDVHGMRLCKHSIDDYAKTIPGLTESIIQGNRCIYPYVLMGLNGIVFDDIKRQEIVKRNDRLMMQYIRMINIFKGDVYKDMLLPTSTVSCVRYFHDYLHLDVVARSQNISKKTGKQLRNPSLNEKAMYKLKMKYGDNPMIDICLKYRQIKKETSMLKFEDWDIERLPA